MQRALCMVMRLCGRTIGLHEDIIILSPPNIVQSRWRITPSYLSKLGGGGLRGGVRGWRACLQG